MNNRRERGTVLLVSVAILFIGAVMAFCYWKTIQTDKEINQTQLRTAQSLSVLQGQFERQLALYHHKQKFGEASVQFAYDPYQNLPQEQPQPQVVAASTGFEISFKDAPKKETVKTKTSSSTYMIMKAGGTFNADPENPGYDNVFITISR